MSRKPAVPGGRGSVRPVGHWQDRIQTNCRKRMRRHSKPAARLTSGTTMGPGPGPGGRQPECFPETRTCRIWKDLLHLPATREIRTTPMVSFIPRRVEISYAVWKKGHSQQCVSGNGPPKAEHQSRRNCASHWVRRQRITGLQSMAAWLK